MAANFDTPITAPLGRLRSIQRGALTFASDIMELLTAAFGPSNPFGTASTLDAGTAAGEVPILNSDARIEPSLIPAATETQRGTVMLATSANDRRPGVVPTRTQITGLTQTALFGVGLNADNFTISQLTSNVDFQAPGTGLLLLASGGGGGHAPNAGSDYLGTGVGSPGTPSRLRYDATRTSNTGAIVVSGGEGGGQAAAASSDGLIIPPFDSTQPGAPDFVVAIPGKGGQGGDPGGFDPNTSVTGGGVVGIPGGNGDLLIAKIGGGRTFRALFGSGGDAGTAPNASRGQRRIAARNGVGGYALFLRLR